MLTPRLSGKEVRGSERVSYVWPVHVCFLRVCRYLNVTSLSLVYLICLWEVNCAEDLRKWEREGDPVVCEDRSR